MKDKKSKGGEAVGPMYERTKLQDVQMQSDAAGVMDKGRAGCEDVSRGVREEVS